LSSDISGALTSSIDGTPNSTLPGPAISHINTILGSGGLDPIKNVSATLAFMVKEGDICLNHGLSGGAMMDMGCEYVTYIQLSIAV
jgi:hypothetical protein